MCVSQPVGSVMATAMTVVTTVTRRHQNAVSLALANLWPLFIKFNLLLSFLYSEEEAGS